MATGTFHFVTVTVRPTVCRQQRQILKMDQVTDFPCHGSREIVVMELKNVHIGDLANFGGDNTIESIVFDMKVGQGLQTTQLGGQRAGHGVALQIQMF